MKKVLSLLLVFAMILSFGAVASAKTVKLGDLDGNGRITASDARTILRYASKLDAYDSEQLTIADIDKNGKISASDARTVLRIASKLEADSGDVIIGETGEQTEVSSGIGMLLSNFIAKFGPLSAVGTSDGTKMYRNSELIVVSDPKMIDDNKVSSIVVSVSSYTVNGIHVGMTADEAKTALNADGWTVKTQSDSLVVYEKTNDINIVNVTVSDGNVIKIELCLAYSIADEKPSEDNSGNNSEKPSDYDDAFNENYLDYETLPDEAKYFLSGEFGLKGSIYSDGVKNSISMYTDTVNINMSINTQMDDGTDVDISLLVLDEGKSEKNIYMLNNTEKKYCELNDATLAFVGMNKSNFNFNLTVGDASSLKITSGNISENGVDYTVYKAVGTTGVTYLYLVCEKMVKVVTEDFYGNLLSAIEIEELWYPLPENCFSYSGYKKALSLIDTFVTIDIFQ